MQLALEWLPALALSHGLTGRLARAKLDGASQVHVKSKEIAICFLDFAQVLQPPDLDSGDSVDACLDLVAHRSC